MVLSSRENNDNKWMAVMNKNIEILKIFPEGVMVESTIGEGGPSEVFVGDSGHTQPFSYLDDYEPSHFRIVTQEEWLDPAKLVGNQSTDAYRWAQSFMNMIDKGHFTKDEIDEGLMIAWFANAIETAKDSTYNG